MENTEQITIITTLRVDSSERQRNMDAVLRYLFCEIGRAHV